MSKSFYFMLVKMSLRSSQTDADTDRDIIYSIIWQLTMNGNGKIDHKDKNKKKPVQVEAGIA